MVNREFTDGSARIRRKLVVETERRIGQLETEPTIVNWRRAIEPSAPYPTLRARAHRSVAASPSLPENIRAASVVALSRAKQEQGWTNEPFNEELQAAVTDRLVTIYDRMVAWVDDSTPRAGCLVLCGLGERVLYPAERLAPHYSAQHFDSLMGRLQSSWPEQIEPETARVITNRWSTFGNVINRGHAPPDVVQVGQSAARSASFMVSHLGAAAPQFNSVA